MNHEVVNNVAVAEEQGASLDSASQGLIAQKDALLLQTQVVENLRAEDLVKRAEDLVKTQHDVRWLQVRARRPAIVRAASHLIHRR